jgi:hypothetical protein
MSKKLGVWRRARVTAPTLMVCAVWGLATLIQPPVARADDAAAVAPVPLGTGGPADTDVADPLPDSPESAATVDFSTGTARSSFTFKMPPARGNAQPSLALQYNSAAGNGPAGVGWSLSLPSIVRKGTSGLAHFRDDTLNASQALGNLDSDDYYIDGQLLVAIAILDSSGHVAVGQVGDGEVFPVLPTNGEPVSWTYYRREIDDGWRYFFDGATWVVQTKGGHTLQFGVPVDQLGVGTPQFAPQATESADLATTHALGPGGDPVYRWNLVRDADASGNTVYYVWDDEHQLISPSASTAGNLFLTDVYDTLAPGATPGPNAFAHHVHLTWASAQFPSGVPQGLVQIPYSWSPIWKAPPIARLAFVDVTSASWNSTQRNLVRSYALQYTSNATETRSYLTSIQEFGDCQSNGGVAENASGLVRTASSTPQSLGCRALPATTYTYYGVSGPNDVPPTLVRDPSSLQYSHFGPISGARMIDIDGDGIDELILQDPFATNTFELATNNLTNLPFTPSANTAAAFGVAGFWNPQSLTLSMIGYDTTGSTFLGQFIQDTALPVNAPPVNQVDFAFSPLSIAGTLSLVQQFLDGAVTGDDVDVDGDGLPDSTLVPTVSASGTTYEAFFTERDRAGVVHPYLQRTTPYCVQGTGYDPTNFGSGKSTPTRGMADIDGDGLADLVIVNKFPSGNAAQGFVNFQVLPDRGDGRYGIALASTGCSTGYGGSIFPISSTFQQSDPVGPDPMQNSIIRFGDLNGDGMADYAVLDSTGLSICIRHGLDLTSAMWRCTTDPTLPLQSFGGSFADIEIADTKGDGVKKVVYIQNTNALNSVGAIPVGVDAFQASNKVREGLLATVSNGAGASTTLTYTNVTTGGNSVWAVQQISRSNGTLSTNVGGLSMGKQYTYVRPIFDPRDRLFVGFQNVSELTLGLPIDVALSGPLLSVNRLHSITFATTSCLAAGGPITTCGEGSGQVDYSLVRAQRGVPVVETINDTGQRERAVGQSSLYDVARIQSDHGTDERGWALGAGAQTVA